VRILAVADEADRSLTVDRLREINPGLVVSCGDLDMDYLDFVSSAANASLVLVPGNHDPELKRAKTSAVARLWYDHDWGAPVQSEDGSATVGGVNADGRIVTIAGLTIAGLGGSIRYREGPNQYTERQMALRARRVRWQAQLRRHRIDLLITHSPPAGMGDESDGPHGGFACFTPLVEALRPRLMLHGHIHPHGFVKPDRNVGETRIVNVIPHKVLEVGP
jgi:hypothetical protein